MGNQLICQSFNKVAGSKLNLKSATLRYVHVAPGHDKQVLEFSGTRLDGTEFNTTSEPFEGSPEAEARKVATSMLAEIQ